MVSVTIYVCDIKIQRWKINLPFLMKWVLSVARAQKYVTTHNPRFNALFNCHAYAYNSQIFSFESGDKSVTLLHRYFLCEQIFFIHARSPFPLIAKRGNAFKPRLGVVIYHKGNIYTSDMSVMISMTRSILLPTYYAST